MNDEDDKVMLSVDVIRDIFIGLKMLEKQVPEDLAKEIREAIIKTRWEVKDCERDIEAEADAILKKMDEDPEYLEIYMKSARSWLKKAMRQKN